MQPNWDPDIKKFLLKVLNSVSLVLLWMMACATTGIYFELGYTNGKPLIYTILFYAGMVITLVVLIRYLYNKWKND
jgi:membrane protein YdbS with pleckstrin-like domain